MRKFLIVPLALLLLIIPKAYSDGISAIDSNLTLSDIIGSISIDPDELFSSHYAIVFSQCNLSVYDSLVQVAANQQDWKNVFYIKRMAEIDGYNSNILDSATKQALSNMPVTGHLPLTWTVNNISYFGTYDRVVLNTYRYASQYGRETEKWNQTQAYSELLQSYIDNGQPSIGYIVGGKDFQWTPRYYGEVAQTADALFKLGGSFSDLWNYAQNYWLGTHTSEQSLSMYSYVQTPPGTSKSAFPPIFERGVGGFAMIWAYLNSQHSLGLTFNRISKDLYNKMLVSGWESVAWKYIPGVMTHGEDSNAPCLGNTLMGIQALQTYYCQSPWKKSFIDMLSGKWGKSAWNALLDSSVYQDGKFAITTSTTPSIPSATGCGMMLLFLEGIIPDTGSLAMPLNEERCEDVSYGYPYTQFKFDYVNRKIVIPIHAGNIKFQYGTQLTSCYFPNDGIYEIYFSNDWNTVTNATKISELIEFQYLTPSTINLDINNDEKINIADLTIIANAFGKTINDENWNQATDINNDKIVNILDLTTLAILY